MDITDSTEEEKEKLRGALRYFNGDKNNINVQVKIEEETKNCGQIYLTEEILEVFQNILGRNQVKIDET